MIYGATLKTYRSRENGTTLLLLLAGVAVAALLALIITLAQGSRGLMPAAVIVAALVVIPCIWRWPSAGAYILLFSAVVFDEHDLTFGLHITDQIPGFKDLQVLIGIRGLAMNPVELLAIIGISLCFLRGRAAHEKFAAGPLARPFAIVVALCALALVRGHQAGGDMTVALWGIRGIGLMLLAYLLTLNVITTRRQVRVLAALLVFGAAFKGLIGYWRLVVDLHGHLGSVADASNGISLLAHEESFFFTLVLFLALLAFVFGLEKSSRRPLLFSLAIVLLPLLANERRAAVAGLVLGVFVLSIVLYRLEPQSRRMICRALLIAVLLIPPYFAWGWSHDNVLTEPVQAVKSAFTPDSRDASSNHYREIEDHDLRATAAQDRLLGVGFGLKMAQPEELPDIGSTYTWYLYLPHNNLLWIGMTMGLLGLVAFLYLVASFGLRSLSLIVAAPDRELRVLGAFALLALTSYLVVGMLDQGILSMRIGVLMGVLMGLVVLAPSLPAENNVPVEGKVLVRP